MAFTASTAAGLATAQSGEPRHRGRVPHGRRLPTMLSVHAIRRAAYEARKTRRRPRSNRSAISGKGSPKSGRRSWRTACRRDGWTVAIHRPATILA